MRADCGVTVTHVHNLGAKKGDGAQNHVLDGLPSERRVGISLYRRLGEPARMGREILDSTVFEPRTVQL